MGRIGAAAATLLVACSLARGTTLVHRDDPDLARSAPLVLRGVVLEVTSAYRAGPIPVFTDVAVEVLEVLKGQVDDPVLHVALPGGEADGHSYQVAGTPTFTPGDEVVLFLTRLASGEWVPLGFSQGARRLVPDPATGIREVERMDRGVARWRPEGARGQARRALRAARDWPSFRRQLRDWIGGAR